MKANILSKLVLQLCCAFPVLAADLSFEEGATRHLRETTEGGVPGLAVLAARDGKIVFQGGFGLAELSEDKYGTRFRKRLLKKV